MTDYAFLKSDSGQFVCGLGPFREVAKPPENGTAFYVNDFELSDPQPWKVPAEAFCSPDLAALRLQLNGGGTPEIEWQALGIGVFQNVYESIQADIITGTLEKTVPVLTEHGRLIDGQMEALLAALEQLPAAFFSYGLRQGQKGLLGATPELLFALHGRHLETMALAGTTPAKLAEVFKKDPKEIHEHEYVAEYLLQKLCGLGEVSREPRQLLDLGRIAHFISPIHVELDKEPVLDDLIDLMHPTPALGSFPRNDESLGKLRQYREQLQAPRAFGAPFGVIADGAAHFVVAIRNLSWDHQEVFLPSGCGVVRESSFENEWRELSLKRQAVKQLLGL